MTCVAQTPYLLQNVWFEARELRCILLSLLRHLVFLKNQNHLISIRLQGNKATKLTRLSTKTYDSISTSPYFSMIPRSFPSEIMKCALFGLAEKQNWYYVTFPHFSSWLNLLARYCAVITTLFPTRKKQSAETRQCYLQPGDDDDAVIRYWGHAAASPVESSYRGSGASPTGE